MIGDLYKKVYQLGVFRKIELMGGIYEDIYWRYWFMWLWELSSFIGCYL